MQQIREFFEKNFSLSDRDWKLFSSKLVKKEFPKKHCLLPCGEVENYLSFVEKGILRFYIPKEDLELRLPLYLKNTS